jgi:outer membrane receptor protein involved in Fe transport
VNVDWHIVKGFTLTAGGRYSRNTLDFNITEKSPTYVGGVSTNNGTIKEKPFTPKVSLSYEPTDRTLLYATYARGFRTGGVNKTVPLPACQSDLTALGFAAQPKDYSSDTTDSYEVGAKGRFFGNALRVEASGFQINWNNIQQQIRLTCAYPIVLNTGKARSRGFDLNIVLRPARGLELGTAVGYDKAIYLQTIQTGAKATVFAGQKLPIAPWTVNSFAEYHFQVADHDSFVRIQNNFTGRNKGPFPYQNPITTAYDPAIRPSEAINQVDLRAGITLGKFTWEVFSQNLFNDHPILDRAALFAGSPFRTERTIRPRTIGAMATLRM